MMPRDFFEIKLEQKKRLLASKQRELLSLHQKKMKGMQYFPIKMKRLAQEVYQIRQSLSLMTEYVKGLHS